MEEQKMGKDSRYISGIYNYCNRWCERCHMTSRCRVYADTERKKAEHIRKGEDPYDRDVVMQDVKEDFEKTIQLLQKAAEEEGIDLSVLPDEPYEEVDPHDHPLNLQAKNYMHAAHDFLKKFREALQAEGYDLAERIEIMPSPDSELEGFEEISDCYEVIAWYHTLIHVKIHRALSSKIEAGMEKEEELAQHSQDDADGSAKVAYEGLVKSIMALQKIYKWNEYLQDDTLHLMIKADRLRRGIDVEFPGHHHFKRPGFPGPG